MARLGRRTPAHQIRPHVPLIPRALTPVPILVDEGATVTVATAVEAKLTAVAVEPATRAVELMDKETGL